MHAEPFKTSRFLVLSAIINKYSAAMKTGMHCSHIIFKTLGKLLNRQGRCLKTINYIFLIEKNVVCYRKTLFDPGIQVWLVNVEEALETEIYGAF